MKRLPLKKYVETSRYAWENFIMGEAIYPFYASFKVTHHCSLQCSFCNVWMEKSRDLDTKDIFQILDNIDDSSIIVLSIEGGDPLARKDICDILKYAHNKSFILFFTTNGSLIDKTPMNEYAQHTDYIHISIDEGHDNLDLFDRIEEFQRFGPEICIQIVVTKDTIPALEQKVKRIYHAKARTVIMPACHLDGTKDYYPNPLLFKKEILRLKNKYPNCITTPNGFLENINKIQGCSTSSIIIDSDGGLFYPCRTIGQRLYNFTEGSFMDFLKTDEAKNARNEMKKCRRSCGWYQYFATDVFTSPQSIVSSLKPYILK